MWPGPGRALPSRWPMAGNKSPLRLFPGLAAYLKDCPESQAAPMLAPGPLLEGSPLRAVPPFPVPAGRRPLTHQDLGKCPLSVTTGGTPGPPATHPLGCTWPRPPVPCPTCSVSHLLCVPPTLCPLGLRWSSCSEALERLALAGVGGAIINGHMCWPHMPWALPSAARKRPGSIAPPPRPCLPQALPGFR